VCASVSACAILCLRFLHIPTGPSPRVASPLRRWPAARKTRISSLLCLVLRFGIMFRVHHLCLGQSSATFGDGSLLHLTVAPGRMKPRRSVGEQQCRQLFGLADPRAHDNVSPSSSIFTLVPHATSDVSAGSDILRR
jgi:hypothetical protein